MSVVMRYWVRPSECYADPEFPLDRDGEFQRVVRASDYDRDTQVLQRDLNEHLSRENIPKKYIKLGGVTYAVYGTSSIDCVNALQRRVEELDKRAGCWHGETGHACQLDDVVRLTTQLAAAREALKAITQGGT